MGVGGWVGIKGTTSGHVFLGQSPDTIGRLVEEEMEIHLSQGHTEDLGLPPPHHGILFFQAHTWIT